MITIYYNNDLKVKVNIQLLKLKLYQSDIDFNQILLEISILKHI